MKPILTFFAFLAFLCGQAFATEARPNIILIDQEGKAHVIRDNETIDNVMSMEHTPAHLK